MTNFKWYHYLLSIIIILFIFIKISKTSAENIHRDIRLSPKKYCYSPEFGYYLWVIEDLSYAENYIDYFQNDSPFSKRVKFKFETIPNNSEVYLLGYEHDSTLTEVACYYFKEGYGQFVKGYIYSELLYDKPVNNIANPNGDKAIPIPN